MNDLKVLDLSDNDVEDFDGDFEAAFPSLDSLYLDGNEIETMPERLEPLFSRLKNLTLHDNPLHCNCEVGRCHKQALKNECNDCFVFPKSIKPVKLKVRCDNYKI